MIDFNPRHWHWLGPNAQALELVSPLNRECVSGIPIVHRPPEICSSCLILVAASPTWLPRNLRLSVKFECDLYVYISVNYFYVKYRDFMLEWSPSLPPKMPICLDLVIKLCSINNSSIHWKLTLSHWCHIVINYGDPDVIDNSLRSGVSGYLYYILFNQPDIWFLQVAKKQPSLSCWQSTQV